MFLIIYIGVLLCVLYGVLLRVVRYLIDVIVFLFRVLVFDWKL